MSGSDSEIITGLIILIDAVSEYVGGRSLLDAEIVAGLLGVAAGVLAILFQRRAEFVTTVRAEWTSCLDAITAIRCLYLMPQPNEAQYFAAYSRLSAAIDGMRAVYRNCGETDTHVGYYPFATLHDLRLFLEHDFAGGVVSDAAVRKQRLEEVDSCWRMFRRRFLAELETPEPDEPILVRRASDPRKQGVGLWRRLMRRKGEGHLLASTDLAVTPPRIRV